MHQEAKVLIKEDGKGLFKRIHRMLDQVYLDFHKQTYVMNYFSVKQRLLMSATVYIMQVCPVICGELCHC